MTTSTTSAETVGDNTAPVALAFFCLAAGPVIAALVLWAAAVLYTDRLLAGFIYALCLVLFGLAATAGLVAHRHALARAGERVLSVCALVTLAYAALPMPLVAAAAVVLACDALTAALGTPEPGAWKTTLEKAGLAAFFAFQAAALLLAPPGVAMGLDWAARILMWGAAAFALVGAAQALTRAR